MTAAVTAAYPTTTGLGGETVGFVARSGYKAAVAALRDAGYEMCADVCAVDYLGHPGRVLPDGVAPERFEVVVNLLSLSKKERTRLRVQVPEGDCVVDSLFELCLLYTSPSPRD